MEDYYQRPFDLQEENDGSIILYSAGGAAAIENSGLIRIIKKLFTPEGGHVKFKPLEKACREEGLDETDVIDFLTKKVKLLTEVSGANGVHRELILISDERCMEALFDALGDITPHRVITRPCNMLSELSEVIKVCHKPMVVLYTEEYSAELIKKIYRAGYDSENLEVSFVTSYFLHDSFIADAIYSPLKNTPCHFCHYDMWYEQALNREFTTKSSWFSFYKKANDNNWPISRSLPLTITDRHACLFYLRRKLLPFFGGSLVSSYPENLVSFFQLRLPSGRVHSDIVPHSDSCTCSGGSYVI